MLTALSSFLEYHFDHCPLFPFDTESNLSLFGLTSQLVDIQFKLSSLYSTAHITAFIFSAFTEQGKYYDHTIII